MVVAPDLQDLCLGQTREAEHPDLVRDVVPCAGGAQRFELCPKLVAHSNDAARHGPQIFSPFGHERRVVEHDAGDAGAVDWWVRDFGALEDGEL